MYIQTYMYVNIIQVQAENATELVYLVLRHSATCTDQLGRGMCC